MWVSEDELRIEMDKEHERRRRQFQQTLQETERKQRLREEFISETKCPHCGRHDPIPIWLE